MGSFTDLINDEEREDRIKKQKICESQRKERDLLKRELMRGDLISLIEDLHPSLITEYKWLIDNKDRIFRNKKIIDLLA